MDRPEPAADWRDGDAYAALLGAERSLFAWEWLRRDPVYVVACSADGAAGAAAARRWGLHRFEDPCLGTPEARPIWRAACHPYVLKASAKPPGKPGDALDLTFLSGLATRVSDAEGEHWLFSDGFKTIRLDLCGRAAPSGPVELHYRLVGRVSALRPLLALRRLLALAETGAFSKALHPKEPRARRWILALRVHDALAAGASQREIAATLLSNAACGARWRLQAGSVRSQVQRLVRSARLTAAGSYRELLR